MPDFDIASVIKSAEHKEMLKTTDHKVLARRLHEKIWAHLDLFSEESDLISEAIDRLKSFDQQRKAI
jgi:hypothetical protein